MPIPGPLLNLVRNSGNQVVVPTYNYWPAQMIARGYLTETPLQYPIGRLSVAWNGGRYQDIEAGMLWIVRAGVNRDLVSYGVVRRGTANQLQLYIDGKSRGDPGIGQGQISAFDAGQEIMVYSVKPLWSLVSRIVDGQFYKEFDLPYDGSGSNPNPVANIGSWRQAWANSSGVAEFTFSATNSFGWQGKLITGYSWQLPTGAVIVSGTINEPVITIRLPQGFHRIRCTVSDSSGKSSIATRPIWVNGDDFPPLSEQMAFQINSDTQNRQGRSQNVTFVGELDKDTFLPGVPIFYTETVYIDGIPVSDNSIITTFAGFASAETHTIDLLSGEKATTVDVLGPFQRMEEIPMVSQAVVEVPAPSSWTDIGEGLGIPQFVAWYILRHHCTYLELFDYRFYWDVNPETNEPDNERKLNWGFNGSSIAEYLLQVASVIAGNIGCISDGSLYLRRDPMVESSAYRDSLDVRMTITANEETGIVDIVSPVEMPKQYANPVGTLKIFSMSYQGGGEDFVASFGSIAPGYYQMQANGSQDEDSIIIKSNNGILQGQPGFRLSNQDRTNEISGHMLAKRNNPTPEIALSLKRNMDFFDPALMLWTRLNLRENWNPRKQLVNFRTLPVSVERSWEESDNGVFTKNVILTVEPETFGQPGETFILDKGGGATYPPITPPILVDTAINDDDRNLEQIMNETGALFAVNAVGRFARNKNGKNWVDIGSMRNGNALVRVNDFAFDFFSAYPLSGFTQGPLGMWVAAARESASNSGVFDTLLIYYTPNALAQSPTWTLQYQNSLPSDIHGSIRIRSNPEINGYVACVVQSARGNYCYRTTNGSSWSVTAMGDILPTASLSPVRKEIDFAFQGSMLVSSGYSSASGGYRLGYFTTPVTNWVFAVDSPIGDTSWPTVEATYAGGPIYATRITASEGSTNSQLGELVRELGTQTAYGVEGSRVPTLVHTATGGLNISDVAVTRRGSPDSGLGLGDPQLPAFAGYTDWRVPTPTGREYGICASGDMESYFLDDGWIPNLRGVRAPSDFDGGTPIVKIHFTFDFRGSIDMGRFSTGGRFAYNSTTGSSCMNPYWVGIYTVFLELYDSDGILRNVFYRIEDNLPLNAGWLGWGIDTADAYDPLHVYNTYATDLSPDAMKDIRRVVLKFEMPAESSNGFGTPMPSLRLWDFTIDNYIMEELDLFRVFNITTVPYYEDITYSADGSPQTRAVPTAPYALSIDPLDNATINAVFERNTFGVRQLAFSQDFGSSWFIPTTDATDLRGLRIASDFGIAWGINRLEISTDGFLDPSNTVNVLGDWHSSIDGGGKFRVLKGVLMPEQGG